MEILLSYSKQYIMGYRDFQGVCKGYPPPSGPPSKKIRDAMIEFRDRLIKFAEGRVHIFSRSQDKHIDEYNLVSVTLDFSETVWYTPYIDVLAKDIKENLILITDNIDLIEREKGKILEEVCRAACH